LNSLPADQLAFDKYRGYIPEDYLRKIIRDVLLGL
jgi:serine/threonine protein kinase